MGVHGEFTPESLAATLIELRALNVSHWAVEQPHQRDLIDLRMSSILVGLETDLIVNGSAVVLELQKSENRRLQDRLGGMTVKHVLENSDDEDKKTAVARSRIILDEIDALAARYDIKATEAAGEDDIAPPSPGTHARSVTLPSGIKLEVQYFDPEEIDKALSPKEENETELRDLRICPECDKDRVYPKDWHGSILDQWVVELRCPDCEWTEMDAFDQATVDKFDENLDLGTEALVRDGRRLIQANMEEEADRFAAALEADAILPEDF